MQMTHQDDRERERQAAAAPAGPQGPEQAGTSDTTNTDPPPSAEQIARVLNGGLPGYDEGTSALSRSSERRSSLCRARLRLGSATPISSTKV